MFHRYAARALAALWPFHWEPVYRGGVIRPWGHSGRPSRWPWHIVCARPDIRSEVDAPAPLHFIFRLALWPFALLDWAVGAVYSIPRTLDGIWRLPNFSLPWPPLP